MSFCAMLKAKVSNTQVDFAMSVDFIDSTARASAEEQLKQWETQSLVGTLPQFSMRISWPRRRDSC